MKGEFVQVPPPAKAPVYSRAQELGLLPWLSVEKPKGYPFRCSNCNEMQSGAEESVWVPDFTRMGESAASIEQAARANAFNGHLSGWCIPCVRKLTRKSGYRPAPELGAPAAAPPRPRRWWWFW